MLNPKNLFLLLTSLLLSCQPSNDAQLPTKGNLLIIGGGARPDYIMQKFVDLCGGDKAKIAVIPTASSYYLEAGVNYVEKFLSLGAGQSKAFNILNHDQADSDSLADQLKEYSGFFFGGGNQNTLTDIFLNSKALSLLHKKYQNGATLGGTSAGAAIMSSVMITGDGNWTVLEKDSVLTGEGFGFLAEMVIDQHFFKRQRFNRLLNVVMAKKIIGIGIDESTAIWVKPDGLVEVLGKSVVMVLDPYKSDFSKQDSTGLLSGKNLNLSIYKPGQIFRYY